MGVAAGILGGIAQLIVPFALFFWGRQVARRRGGRGWRMVAWVPLVALLAPLIGMAGTVVELVYVFSAVAAVDPAHKSAVLSAGISQAMNATFAGVVAALAAYVASVIAFAVGTFVPVQPADPVSAA